MPLYRWLLILTLMVVAPCRGDDLYQYSTINALLKGQYDGQMELGELASHGNFGLGTVNGLDGELVLLDGMFYRIAGDGVAYRASWTRRTPFAMVTRFRPSRRHVLPDELDLPALQGFLDTLIESPGHFQAIRVDAAFASLTVRSVDRQELPYRPLAAVIKEQKVHEFHHVSGTLVGFRSPPMAPGIGVAGYHFHFISDDRRFGGHVLALRTGSGRLAIDDLQEFTVSLPERDAFAAPGQVEAQGRVLEQVEGGAANQ